MKSELDIAFKGKCENCNKKNVWVRRVESTCVISTPGGTSAADASILYLNH